MNGRALAIVATVSTVALSVAGWGVFVGIDRYSDWKRQRNELIADIDAAGNSYARAAAISSRSNDVEVLSEALDVMRRSNSQERNLMNRFLTVIDSKPFLPLTEYERNLRKSVRDYLRPVPSPTPTPVAIAAATPVFQKSPTPTVFLNLRKEVQVHARDGRTITFPPGTRLELNTRISANYVRIRYLNQLHDIPVDSTDLAP